MTLRSNGRTSRKFIRTALSMVLIMGAAMLCSLPAPADTINNKFSRQTLIAVEPEDEGRLPPPPALKRRGGSDEQGPQFQPEPVDDGNGPQFGGDRNREMIMRRRAIRQKMRQQFGQQGGFGNEGPGMDAGQNPEFPGRAMPGMRGGFAPGFGNEEGAGPMPGFGGQGGQGMRRFRGGGQGMRRFGGDGQPGLGAEGGPGGLGGPDAPGGMRGPGGPDGGPGMRGQGGPGFGGDGGFGGGAFRQRRGGMGGGMSGGGFGAGKQLDLTPLGLTEPQKTKIQAMRQQTKMKLRDLKKGLSEKQSNMRNLMFSPDATEAQIRGARRELRTLQDQMDETNLNDLLAIRSLLTPEQRKKLPDCMPGRGRGPGFPDGPRGPGGPDGQANAGPTAFESSGSESRFAAKSGKNGGMYRRHAAKQSGTSSTK
ncbi:MAG: Spy/CpxP family protein refolding chaperone [Candidatus Obscuribacterales bacterium]|nr:Spy/CpxP family protein refolding chaperone [Candidatus Obscuribacterales bacterium]